jgi:hypothetical protein
MEISNTHPNNLNFNFALSTQTFVEDEQTKKLKENHAGMFCRVIAFICTKTPPFKHLFIQTKVIDKADAAKDYDSLCKKIEDKAVEVIYQEGTPFEAVPKSITI